MKKKLILAVALLVATSTVLFAKQLPWACKRITSDGTYKYAFKLWCDSCGLRTKHAYDTTCSDGHAALKEMLDKYNTPKYHDTFHKNKNCKGTIKGDIDSDYFKNNRINYSE